MICLNGVHAICLNLLLYTVALMDGKLKETWIPCAHAQTVPFHVSLNAGRITFQSLQWNLVMVNMATCDLFVVSFVIYTVQHMSHAYHQYLQAQCNMHVHRVISPA